MNRNSLLVTLLAGATLLAATAAHGQVPPPREPQPPIVTVSASATATLPNDRMTAWMRADSDNASAKVAAADVNARIAAAMKRLQGVPAITTASAGYSTNPITEKDRPTRWHVTQTIKLESADFSTLATEIGALQESGLLFSSMAFSLSEDARRRAEDSVTQDAIRAWQQRAQNAATGFGYGAWRVGEVSVQTSDGGRPFPMMVARSDMKVMAAPMPAPAVDAGT
ncbi:MAG: SIMPL domain-containing protein, partial [Proteobacteria bacterium]|nr:SIMPL domain-containing protein [Pseudomonadota bacterium]